MLLLVFSQGKPFEETILPRFQVEEQVFWMLIVFLDELLPLEMFGQSLKGSQLDQTVLWQQVITRDASRWGLVPLKFWINTVESGVLGQNSAPPFETITTQWFLTLYINSLPTEVFSIY